MTEDEKLLLATHRAQKLTTSQKANSNALALERARWENMRGDLNASSLSAQEVAQMKTAILARQTQGGATSATAASHANPLVAALLSHRGPGGTNNLGTQRAHSQSNGHTGTTSTSQENPLVAFGTSSPRCWN